MNKLNVLLVMPRLVNTIGEGYQFPLGIAYISASLKYSGFNVFTINLNHDSRSIPVILEEAIREHKINIVGSGGISIQYNSLYEIYKCVKYISPKVITIAGGGIITADPEVAMTALEFADIGVIGEGEITICNLIQALENHIDLSSVKGIIFARNKQYLITPPQQEIQNIDTIPYPDYDGFELDKYLDLPPPDVNNLMERRLVFFLGSRSCPYNCTFCFHSTGKRYRKRSIESIKEEIDFLIEKYDIGFLFMADELFGKPKKRLKEFCEYIKQKNILWRGSFRVDDIDEETIVMLKNGNCGIIGLGLESADNRILKSMRKHITIEQIEKALKLIYDAKTPFSGNFIFGDINETIETAKNTLAWWEQHLEYNINLWPVIAYPGSYLYKYACENNIIKDKVQFLKEGCPAVNVSKLNDREMGWLAKKLLESPTKKAKNLIDIKITSINHHNGRISIAAKCARCGKMNNWGDIRLFLSVNLACSHCGQKHNTPFPVELQAKIASNIEKLLDDYQSIGIWGITMHTIGLYEEHDIFKSPNIIAIDNASLKQMINLQGKKVFNPNVLADQNIPLVISFYPNSTQLISEQVRQMYPNVERIIDAFELLS